MLVRDRIDPTPGQRRALARAFGCARVVSNHAPRERARAPAATEQLSDAEVQRRVITLAKQTPPRAWLAEVASVALVQACQDARRAYRNWLDSLSGARKGRRVGHPRFRAKHGRQSIRRTRNGFSVRPNGRLYVATIGELRVRCPVRCRQRPPASRSSATRTGATTPRWWSSAPRSRCRRSTASPGSILACARSRQSPPATAAPRPSPSSDPCVRPSVASPAPSGSSAASARARRTGPRPAAGSRLLIAGSATGGPTTTISSPCGCSASTKRSPWKISPWRVGPHAAGDQRPRRRVGDVRPAAVGEGRPPRSPGHQDRPVRADHADLLRVRAPGRPRSRSTCASGHAARAGPATTATGTRPATS